MSKEFEFWCFLVVCLVCSQLVDVFKQESYGVHVNYLLEEKPLKLRVLQILIGLIKTLQFSNTFKVSLIFYFFFKKLHLSINNLKDL